MTSSATNNRVISAGLPRLTSLSASPSSKRSGTIPSVPINLPKRRQEWLKCAQKLRLSQKDRKLRFLDSLSS